MACTYTLAYRYFRTMNFHKTGTLSHYLLFSPGAFKRDCKFHRRQFRAKLLKPTRDIIA